MSIVHAVLGSVVTALCLGVGGWGAWRWWRVEPSEGFWRWLRFTQLLVLVQVALGGVLYALGERGPGELHLLYGVLPVVVFSIAEQLRVAAAETVLEARGLASGQEVQGLPESERRSVVLAIVRRELGVEAFATLVVAALALRAGAAQGLL